MPRKNLDTVMRSVRLPKQLSAELTEFARDRNTTFSHLLRLCAEIGLAFLKAEIAKQQNPEEEYSDAFDPTDGGE